MYGLTSFLSYINWNVDPEIVSLGPLSLRWYGLLFASGFFVGQLIMLKIYRVEGKKESDVESLTLYMVLATIIGARLGHCLFYQPEYYLSNPLKILMVWEGGLASHGAAVGILTGLYLYSKSRVGQSYLWVLDRVVITIALAAFFIRTGNLMNSEIIGLPTTVPWAFIFERVDMVPRHPAQFYEALSSLVLFVILYFGIYQKYKARLPEGRIFGIFLIWIFGLRFVYEFFKENQVAFEEGMSLNMGQILSIPLVIAGFIILYNSFQKEKLEQTTAYQQKTKRPNVTTSAKQ